MNKQALNTSSEGQGEAITSRSQLVPETVAKANKQKPHQGTANNLVQLLQWGVEKSG